MPAFNSFRVVVLLVVSIDEGHVVGYAWYSGYGADPRNMSQSDLKNALAAQATSVYNAIGVYPRFVRFPYSMLNQDVDQIASAMGFRSTYWNIDVQDYNMCTSINTTGTTDTAVSFYTSQLNSFKQAGNLQSSFISLHTDLCNNADLIGRIIDATNSFNYTSVTLDKCVGGSPYKAAASSDVESPSTSGAVTPAQTTSTTTPSSSPLSQQSAPGAAEALLPTTMLTMAGLLVSVAAALGF